MTFTRLLTKAFLGITLAAALFGIATRLDPIAEGLSATYYATTNWLPPAVHTGIDAQPTTDAIRSAWHDQVPPTFSATWSGSFLAPADGTYVFSTISDDASWVYVDGALVVDNGGRHGAQPAAGSTTLTFGVHSVFVEYVQEGGDFHLELLWSRDGATLAPIPSWAMAPRQLGFRRFLARAAVKRALAAVEWLWVLSAVALVLAAISRAGEAGRRWLVEQGAWSSLRWILGASFVLNLAGIWWGVPGGTWAGDELLPSQILGAATRHFSHGWFDPYPPLHFYILTAAFSPTWLLAWLGRLDLVTASTIFVLTARSITLAMSVVTVAAVYACGARAFSQRAGILGAAVFALVAPFVYYAKTANMEGPYLCWIALALVFYVRLLVELKLSDFVAFAVFATLATCTKDQAAGLFMLPSLVIVYRLWQANRVGGPSAITRAVLDSRLWVAAAVATLVFALCHNILFNFRGFVAHVRFITTSGIAGYAMFPATAPGRAALLGFSADLVRRSFGWPLFLTGCAGIVIAIARRQYHRPALWLAAPALSYYLTFINVIRYSYDRFMLPVSLVLALFGGLALDTWVSTRNRAQPWRLAAVGVLFAYSVLYTSTVDVLMIRDSRYATADWIEAHIGPTELIGFTYAPQYSPRFAGHSAAEIRSIDQLQRDRPAYYVLDADYARSEAPQTETGRLIAGLQSGALGYHLVYRYRRPSPWPWLPGGHDDLVGPRVSTVVASSLRHINPTFEIFKRES